MLQNIKLLYGKKLEAKDGEIGHVKDFYFDDQGWVVRYLIADTGTWLTGRQVLLSPHAFGSLHQAGKHLLVNLTRKQIEGSPAIDSQKPVSRQHEEEYYRYYNWPYYWQGAEAWGMSAYPTLAQPLIPLPIETAKATCPPGKHADAHLRSTQSVCGYHVHATDGEIGHVSDFKMDTKSWTIRQLVVETGNWFSGKDVLLPATTVTRISYDESMVFVNVTKAAIEKSPEYHGGK